MKIDDADLHWVKENGEKIFSSSKKKIYANH